MGKTPRALLAVRDERRRQDRKWGVQDHDDGLNDPGVRNFAAETEYFGRLLLRNEAVWAGILLEEVGEALQAPDPAALRSELVQVAAVAVAWIEALDRRTQATGGLT